MLLWFSMLEAVFLGFLRDRECRTPGVLRLGSIRSGEIEGAQEPVSTHHPLGAIRRRGRSKSEHSLREPENCRLGSRKWQVFSRIAFTVAFYHLAVTSMQGSVSERRRPVVKLKPIRGPISKILGQLRYRGTPSFQLSRSRASCKFALGLSCTEVSLAYVSGDDFKRGLPL